MSILTDEAQRIFIIVAQTLLFLSFLHYFMIKTDWLTKIVLSFYFKRIVMIYFLLNRFIRIYFWCYIYSLIYVEP